MDADVVFYLVFLDHTRENKKQNNLRGKTKKKAYEMSFVFLFLRVKKNKMESVVFRAKASTPP